MTIEEIRSGIDTRGTGECSKLTSVFCDRKTVLTATRSNKKTVMAIYLFCTRNVGGISSVVA
jgi:hypothetical protein